MYRFSLYEALRQKPKTLEFLERIRKVYMRKINKAGRDELRDFHLFFRSKEAEIIAHDVILREVQADLPHYVTPELLASKTRMIIFWRGLKEEVERRMT